jgi:hypothetical protein
MEEDLKREIREALVHTVLWNLPKSQKGTAVRYFYRYFGTGIMSEEEIEEEIDKALRHLAELEKKVKEDLAELEEKVREKPGWILAEPVEVRASTEESPRVQVSVPVTSEVELEELERELEELKRKVKSVLARELKELERKILEELERKVEEKLERGG